MNNSFDSMALAELVDSVSRHFKKVSGRDPVSMFIAPGRVNIIGEHIDYNGFGVLPCAVAKFTVVAIGVGERSISQEDVVVLSISRVGTDTGGFERVFDKIERVPKEEHDWTNYVLGVYLSLIERSMRLPGDLQLVVGGNLPQACGLSSSSSLVVACALALSSMRYGSEYIPRKVIADLCMRSEWLVGTAGGGMDQAAILCAEAGSALHIEFNPLRTKIVKLSEECVLLVANSMALSAKAETGTSHQRYNKRVFECKVGLYILRRNLIKEGKDIEKADMLEDTFHDLMRDLGHKYDQTGGEDGFDEMIAHCRSILQSNPYSREDISSLINDPKDLEVLTLKGRWGEDVWLKNESFCIQSRAIHCYSEAKRVIDFISACNNGDVIRMANLMNDSNTSCDLLYDCSCPELRSLVRIMLEAGCLGARLTGAGWGGCAVGLANRNNVEKVVAHINTVYGEEICFAFEPAAGARLE